MSSWVVLRRTSGSIEYCRTATTEASRVERRKSRTSECKEILLIASTVSGVTQNRPLRVEIKGVKTGHFLEPKTALLGLVAAGQKRHVECPESEPANDNLQFTRSRLVWAPDCTRAWDQSRDRRPVFAVSGPDKPSHFDPRLGRG